MSTGPEPIYTHNNCLPAYQLRWGLTLFWRAGPCTPDWLGPLKEATEPDGVRILAYRPGEEGSALFSLSTQPHVCPAAIVRSVKGRLQYLVRDRVPRAFQRNYSLRSVGSARRNAVEPYVRTQAGHHPMADPRVQEMFVRLAIHNENVDLSQWRPSAHGRFAYALHVVFTNDRRWREVDRGTLLAMRNMIGRAAQAKGHLLSRASVLADHVHMLLGGGVEDAPADVALSYMNNLAFASGMTARFEFGYYVGTVGEYDTRALQSFAPPA